MANVTNSLKNRGISFFGKNAVNINTNKIIIKEETIYGRPYTILVLPLLNSKKAYKLVLKEGSEVILGQKNDFKKKLMNSILWRIFTPFIIFCALSLLSFYFSDLSIVVMLLFPVVFGFMTYAMSYIELKDYLKKIADTVSFFSGTVTACLAIIKFDVATESPASTIHSPFINGILIFFLVFFAFFASIKFFISADETFKARKIYLSQFSAPKKRKTFLRNMKTKYLRLQRKVRTLMTWKI